MLYIIAGTILIAIGPFFVEFSGLDAVTSSFYRMLIGAVAFLLIGRFQNKKLPSKQFCWLYVSAGLMTTVDLFCCNQSILYIGSGLSTVLSNLEVLFLLLIGATVFKEKLDRTFPLTCLLIVAGIGLLIKPYYHQMGPNFLPGIGFAIVASFIFSIYLLLLKMISRKNPETSTVVNLGVICAIGATILATVMAFLPNSSFSLPSNLNAVVCVIIYSLMSQVCGWWLISQGMITINLSTSGVLFLVQPALTFAGDCLFLGRNCEVYQITGCLILLATVYKTIQAEERKKEVA